MKQRHSDIKRRVFEAEEKDSKTKINFVHSENNREGLIIISIKYNNYYNNKKKASMNMVE